MTQQEAIAQWLSNVDPKHHEYRLTILRRRYLNFSQERAYRNLIQRLSTHKLIKGKIQGWIALSRDSSRTVPEVIQEVIQEMLHSDRYIQRQVQWIHQCTSDRHLQDALVFTTIEEYCFRPIRNQPLIVLRFVNYLRHSQRGGMTFVPKDEFVRLVSDQVQTEDDETLSLLDVEAVKDFQAQQEQQDQAILCQVVKQEFRAYLCRRVSKLAGRWLDLYLQGHGQDEIAKILNVPVQQIYRLRDRVQRHALQVFPRQGITEVWLGNR